MQVKIITGYCQLNKIENQKFYPIYFDQIIIEKKYGGYAIVAKYYLLQDVYPLCCLNTFANNNHYGKILFSIL